MADTLAVRIERGDSRSVVVDDAFESTGSFRIVLENDGTPAHVHLRMDDALASVASVAAPNHYVEDGEVREVDVAVAEDAGTVTGTLEVVTGYGAERATVAVTVSEPPTVTVDQSLGEPRPERDATTGFDRQSVPLVGAGLVGIVAFVTLATVVGESAALLLGLGALAGGVVVGAYLLARS